MLAHTMGEEADQNRLFARPSGWENSILKSHLYTEMRFSGQVFNQNTKTKKSQGVVSVQRFLFRGTVGSFTINDSVVPSAECSTRGVPCRSFTCQINTRATAMATGNWGNAWTEAFCFAWDMDEASMCLHVSPSDCCPGCKGQLRRTPLTQYKCRC